jgi:ParB family transcriptional regulator, chromosome partitioning protein
MESRLGKGLSSLISSQVDLSSLAGVSISKNAPTKLPVIKLQAGKYQPRRHFNDAEINALADSIAEHGVLQPLVVRKIDGDLYEIIAGERRFRASKIAGLYEVPVSVIEVSDSKALEIAIIENIQRQDLNPIEEAEGYSRLVAEFSYTQEQLAKKLGVSRPKVTNSLRLLELPEEIKGYVIDGRISASHARTIAAHPDMHQYAAQVAENNISVRELENLVKKAKGKKIAKPAVLAHLSKELARQTGMTIKIEQKNPAKNIGRVMIAYGNLDEFNAIVKQLKKI